MLNYFTHSVLFPLTLPMYTRQAYKLFILLMWLFILNVLLLATFLPKARRNNDGGIMMTYRIVCGLIPFVISLVLIWNIINTKQYRSFSVVISFIYKILFSFALLGLYLFTNTSMTYVSASVYIYRIASIVLSGLLVLYLIKNFIYMSRSNNIINKKNTFMKLSRNVQLLLIIFFAGLTTIQFLRLAMDDIISFTNFFDILMLLCFFAVFNFQLYKRIGSNNIMLFPLIYRSKKSFMSR